MNVAQPGLPLGGGPDHDQPLAHDQPAGRLPLNQPVRWLVAAAEVVAAVGSGLLAVWLWGRSSVPVRLPDYDNPAIPEYVSRQSGPWTAAAVGAGLLAALLLLDAVRQLVLAARVGAEPGPGHPPEPDQPGPGESEPDHRPGHGEPEAVAGPAAEQVGPQQ